MAYEPKEGTGSLRRNNKDGGNPNWPDYQGEAMINGVKVRISGWVKTSQNGNRYLSLSLKSENRQQNAACGQSRQQTPPQAKRYPEADDMPF